MRHVSENPGDLPARPLTAADGAHQQPESPVDANPKTAGGKTRRRVVRQQHGARVSHRDLDRSRFADMQCEESDKGPEFGRWRFTGGSGAPSRLRPAEGFRTMTLDFAPNCDRHDHLGGMGLEKTAKGFGEQGVQAARAPFGDERLGLGGEFGWQLGLDAAFLHAAKVARPAWMGRTR